MSSPMVWLAAAVTVMCDLTIPVAAGGGAPVTPPTPSVRPAGEETASMVPVLGWKSRWTVVLRPPLSVTLR